MDEINIESVITDCEIIMGKIETLANLKWQLEYGSPKWNLESAWGYMRDAKEKLEKMKK